MNIHYPILAAFIERDGIPLKDLALELGIPWTIMRGKCEGRVCWTLDECIILRDLFAPSLSIDELFYVLPKQPDKDTKVTEQEMRGGFNPALYNDEA